MRLKPLLGFFVYAATVAIIVGVIAILWANHQFTKPQNIAAPTLLEIERGMGVSAIAHKLEEAALIDNRLIFAAGVRAKGWQRDLQAGEYKIAAQSSMRDIAQQFKEGKTYKRLITIREGLTSFEIVRLLNESDQLTGEIRTIPPEGTLLPETYNIQKGETRADLLVRMARAMLDALDEEWEERADNLPITTKKEALILASIIEKETGKPEEHRAVAGVFINRLRKNMPLQTDPTVIYAITMGKHENDGKGPLGRRLLRKDMAVDSPYNTYKYSGLTPGPIANPGLAAIKAALNPESHDYIYFVADGTGGHVFAKTLAEHNKNAAEWRKIRAAQ